MNLGDVVGQLMRDGMSPQTQSRVGHAVGSNGLGAAGASPDLGALLGSLLGGASGGQSGGQGAGGQGAGGLGAGGLGAGGLGALLGSLLGGASGGKSASQSAGGQGTGAQGAGGLGDILDGLGQMLGQDSGVGGMSKGQIGGLGALAGALLGGGGSAAKGAMGGSAMALLGTLALSALKNWQAQSQKADAVSLTETEVKQITAPETAELCLRGMIEAMKSDGEVSPDEIQRLVGKLSKGGITSDEQKFVQSVLATPQDLKGLVRGIPNPEVGIQVYAAALMAISVDTPAERKFLKDLAKGARLNHQAVARLHQMVGAPVV